MTKAQIAALLDMDDADYDRADSKLQQQAKDAADAKAAAAKKGEGRKGRSREGGKGRAQRCAAADHAHPAQRGTVPDDLWQQSGYSAVTIAAMLRGRKG